MVQNATQTWDKVANTTCRKTQAETIAHYLTRMVLHLRLKLL